MDLTHARALIRIVGADSARVLSKLCGIDFGDTVTPDDSALRTSVARLVAEVIRNDLAEASAAARDRRRLARSYLIMCERSEGSTCSIHFWTPVVSLVSMLKGLPPPVPHTTEE
jgi:hypothetical protein